MILGALYLVQALIADVVAIRAGHVPGMPITTGHGDLLFRTTRAQANTNENLPIFLLLSAAAMLLGAGAVWTNRLAWTFVLARAAHMVAYYADLRPVRAARCSGSRPRRSSGSSWPVSARSVGDAQLAARADAGASVAERIAAAYRARTGAPGRALVG